MYASTSAPDLPMCVTVCVGWCVCVYVCVSMYMKTCEHVCVGVGVCVCGGGGGKSMYGHMCR